MDNQDILYRIQVLVDEEHQLRASAGAGPEAEDPRAADEERRATLRKVEEDLDQ